MFKSKRHVFYNCSSGELICREQKSAKFLRFVSYINQSAHNQRTTCLHQSSPQSAFLFDMSLMIRSNHNSKIPRILRQWERRDIDLMIGQHIACTIMIHTICRQFKHSGACHWTRSSVQPSLEASSYRKGRSTNRAGAELRAGQRQMQALKGTWQ